VNAGFAGVLTLSPGPLPLQRGGLAARLQYYRSGILFLNLYFRNEITGYEQIMYSFTVQIKFIIDTPCGRNRRRKKFVLEDVINTRKIVSPHHRAGYPKIKFNYLLTYDSYVPLYNRFHRGNGLQK
jgi:hypothetical protein